MHHRALLAVLVSLNGAPVASAQDAMILASTPRVAAATIHSIGFEWDLEGDADHDATCAVRFRSAGSSDWSQALPLLRTDYYGWYEDPSVMDTYRSFNMFAGSIMFLAPGTTYEIELSAVDPDGGSTTSMTSVTTLPIPRLGSAVRTLHVAPGNGGGAGTEGDPYRGLGAAVSAAAPGDLLLLHAGDYEGATIDRSGEEGRYVAFKPFGDDEVHVTGPIYLGARVHHVWIEGLVFTPSGGNGIRAYAASEGPGVSDIVVIRNRFVNPAYAISTDEEEWTGDPDFLLRRWYVADNVLEPGDQTEYFMRVYQFAEADIAFNRIAHRFPLSNNGGDAISLRFSANLDVYGNDIRAIDDDFIEPDRAYANIRIWRNRMVKVQYTAVSMQPMFSGPWYLVRNEVVLDDDSVWAVEIIKSNVFDRFVWVNNTFYVRGSSAQDSADMVLRTYSRNNLWVHDEHPMLGGPIWKGYGDGRVSQRFTIGGQSLPDWRTDADYDGFGGDATTFWWNGGTGDYDYYDDLAAFAAGAGIEAHGTSLGTRDEIFEISDIRAYANEAYSSERLTLLSSSRAIDSGAIVPNLADQFAGAAPDLGAYELGEPTVGYGPRPIRQRPAAPTGLAVVAGSDSTLAVASWNAVSLDVAGASTVVAGYRLYYGTTARPAGISSPDDSSFAYSESVSAGTSLSAMAAGLSLGTQYFLSVTALDDVGNESDYSSEVGFRTSNEPPRDGGTMGDGSPRLDDTSGGCACGAAGMNPATFRALAWGGPPMVALWMLFRRRHRRRGPAT